VHVLLIDGRASYRDEFALLLADSGLQCAFDHTSDAAEAARLLARDTHDVCLVESGLVVDDASELCEAVRKAGFVKPLVLLAGRDDPDVDDVAERAAAIDCLVKGSFSCSQLRRAICYAVRNFAASRVAREIERRMQIAEEAADIGTWDWDLATQRIVCSQHLFKMFGVDPATAPPDLHGIWLRAVHPDDHDRAHAAATAVIAGTAPRQSLFRILRPNAADPAGPPELRWIACKGEVLRDANGAPSCVIGINIDVTEQQTALAAQRASREAAVKSLHDSEARFRTYFDNTPDCMFHVRVEPDGRFVYEAVNAAGLASIGLTLDMVRGRTPEDVLGPEKGRTMTDGLRRVHATGLPFHYEPTWEMPAGPVTFDADYLPLNNAAGETTGILGVARDVTEQRRLEASFHQAQKMEALGQLVSGVAHDFNNLLTNVLGCFRVLGQQIDAEPGRRLIAEGFQTVVRGTALTARLLAFARQQPLATQSVDLNATIESMCELLSRTLGSSVRIDTRCSDDLWQADADRNQVELVLLNLAINARDAMPEGGTLTLETFNETLPERRADGLAHGDYAVIAVSDTGSGMAPHVLAHVLEPFFTTKQPGKGTGLGLSMVYGAVSELGGGITISSELGKGTRVSIYLPRARE
jgi:PAS domain S-box-containing protein